MLSNHVCDTRQLVPPDALTVEWGRAADRLLAAFGGAQLDQAVRLVEIDSEVTFPVAAAVGMQLLDTVVHTWDIARSFG